MKTNFSFPVYAAPIFYLLSNDVKYLFCYIEKTYQKLQYNNTRSKI